MEFSLVNLCVLFTLKAIKKINPVSSDIQAIREILKKGEMIAKVKLSLDY